METRPPHRPDQMTRAEATVKDRARPGPYDVFLCYDREDVVAVDRLVEALEDRGMNTWLDRDDIRVGDEWLPAAMEGIKDSHTFVFIATPRSLESDECDKERARAEELRKKMVAALYASVDDGRLHPSLKKREWVDFTDGRDFDRAIEALVAAAREDSAWFREHTYLLERAERWEQADRHPDRLLKGVDLPDAEEWLEQRNAAEGREATALQTQFIYESLEVSRKQREESQKRRRKALIAGLVLGMFLIAGFVWLWQKAEGEAGDSHSRELAGVASFKLASDPQLSILLALEALEESSTREADIALRAAVAQSPIRARLGEPDSSGPGLTDAAFSPTGHRVVTTDDEGGVTIWRSDGLGDPLRLRGHREGLAVWGAEFDPAGKLMLSYGDDRTARIWDARSGVDREALLHPAPVTSAHFVFDGRRIVTAAQDGSWRMWNRRGEKLGATHRLSPAREHKGLMTALGNPKREQVLTVAGREAWLWDIPARAVTRRALPHRSEVTAATFSPNGTFVLTADADWIAKIWSTNSGRLVSTLRGVDGQVFSAAFSPDSKLVVTGNQGGTATAWHSRSGRRLGELVGHLDVVQDVGFTTESPGGDHIVLTGSDDRTARIWQLRPPAFPLRLLNVLDRTVAVLRGGRAFEVRARLDRRGQRVLIAQDDGTASVFDAMPGETMAVHPDAGDFQLTRDGTRTATLNAEGDIAVWDVSSWSRQSDWIKRKEYPSVAFLSPDGRYVLRETAEAAPARIIRVSRARYPEDDVRLPARLGGILSAAFSPNSKLVATGYGDGAIRVWRTETGEPASEGRLSKGGGDGTDFAHDMSFSPDGKLLAVVGSDGSLRVWRLGGRKRPRTLTGHTDQVLGATFSPSGDFLVTSGNDARALVWDRSNWRIVGELEHENTVTSASFSPDERFVVTSSRDGSVRLWDRAAERELTHFDPGRGLVHRTAFAGQRTIVVTSGEGTVTLFRCQVCGSLDSVQRLARRRLRATGRSLTLEERRKYLHEE